MFFFKDRKKHIQHITYIMIYDGPELPKDFTNSMMNIVFGKYQVTDIDVCKHSNIKTLVNEYINYTGSLADYPLIKEFVL